jgi:hypothetical protein
MKDWLIDCEPRPVQLEALRRSYFDRPRPASGWGHFLEMRLGKTPTTLNEFMLFRRDFGTKRLIVLSPNSYKHDWVLEAGKFGIDVPAFAWETNNSKAAFEFAEDADEFVIAINYESINFPEAQRFLKRWVDRKTMVVADESIKIKNHSALVTRHAIALTRGAGPIRALTGLPSVQGPQDFYSQLRFIRQLEGKNFFQFRNRYCRIGGFKNKQIVGIRSENEEELKELLGSCSFIAKRKEWTQMTVPEFYTVSVEPDPVQVRHYKEMDNDFITWLESGEEVTAMQAVSKLLKLQQISSGFLYTESGHPVDLMDPNKIPKMLRLKEMLADEISGKVVVCYHYGHTGDMLLEQLSAYNPVVIRSKDWMHKNDRSVIVEKDRFTFDESCRVAIVNITATKYGHDLSANGRCTTMAFYENNYSLDDRTQVEARITTSWQDWASVYLDFASTKAERDVVTALVKKMGLVEAVLGSYGVDRERKER